MSYSLLDRSAIKARKPHSCIWCGHPILAGSQYVREASIYDGHFQNFAWHEACRKDADDYFDEVGEGELPDDSEMPFFALYQMEAS
ncbi:hypothetical protein PBC5_gp51 [Sinorhizobium phage PBC5]|uniref:hypothetical protein n=1 Tax=Sinorhizobium phage PBC5 TaxID=179237 RepID=UPI001BEC9CAF|nr:hypothetical protein PBC5_gp51 [Sinorhizobium phage PBC5]